MEAGVPPPKSHDLLHLLSLFPGTSATAAVQSAASMVSSYAWLTRYPGAPPVDEPNVRKAEADLSVIKQWALQQCRNREKRVELPGHRGVPLATMWTTVTE